MTVDLDTDLIDVDEYANNLVDRGRRLKARMAQAKIDIPNFNYDEIFLFVPKQSRLFNDLITEIQGLGVLIEVIARARIKYNFPALTEIDITNFNSDSLLLADDIRSFANLFLPSLDANDKPTFTTQLGTGAQNTLISRLNTALLHVKA